MIRRKEAQWLAINFGECPQFSNINRALTGLTLVHERMCHPHAGGYFPLGQSALDTSGDEPR